MLEKLRSLFGKESGSALVAVIFLLMGVAFSYYGAHQAMLNRQSKDRLHALQTEVAQDKEREERLKAASSPAAIAATKEAIARNEEGEFAPGEQPIVPAEPTPTPEAVPAVTPKPPRSEAWWSLFFGK